MIKDIEKFLKEVRVVPDDLEGMQKTHQQDSLVFFVVLLLTTTASFFFSGMLESPDLNIAMFYLLGNFIVARYTAGYLFGFVFAFISMIFVNYFFTYPYNTLTFSLEGYALSFFAMFTISMVTSFMTTSMKKQARILAKQEKELMEAQKEKMRANLLRAVSHDIRTPLTGIIGNSASYLEMEDKLLEEDKRSIVQNIEADANWLLNMVENLLTVTRIDNETARVAKTLEDMEDVVSSAIIRFKKRFPDVELKVKIAEGPIFLMMDPMLIEQVIINILQNALFHAKSTEPVELSVIDEKEQVTVSIKDYGIGIEKNRLETIFDGGGSYKRESDPDGYKGMGIGLSICKTIVTAHGGKLTAENHGRGSSFIFSLPKEMEE